METLSSGQRKQLRSLAHSLKPSVQVGQSGLTPTVLGSVEAALLAHELIKVKLVAFKERRHEVAEELAEASGSALAGLIGSVAILYRPHPQADRRRIRLATP